MWFPYSGDSPQHEDDSCPRNLTWLNGLSTTQCVSIQVLLMCFLNQLRLSPSHRQLAAKLISIYFAFFKVSDLTLRKSVRSDGHTVDVGSDGHTVDVGSDGHTVDVGSDGHTVDVGSDGHTVDVGSDGHTVEKDKNPNK
ncbi:hypothetical protein DPMN_089201 [Dreissena polymorpha]|uniref:Uncharacterized protein n=1 Tax=Dreissena polymorpha TaxID=45954 RepID=A0A9D4KWB8_DREPO|nr:hypothetical protein DPMN_089201 [Dreissena polymorpha]